MANRLLERIQSGGSQSIPVSSNRLLKSIGSGKTQSGPLNIAEIVRRQQEEKKKREPIPGVDFTPVSEFPKEPSLMEKIKEFIIPSRGFSEEQYSSSVEPTTKERLTAVAKSAGEIVGGLAQLPSIATEAVERKFGSAERADQLRRLREESLPSKLSEISQPKTIGEAKTMRQADVITLIPGIVRKSATKALVKASTKDAVISTLKKEGLTVEDSLAELIAKSKDETTIQKLLSNSNIKSASDDAESVASYLDANGNKVFTKINNYEYNRLRDEIRNIPDAERGTNQIHLDADTSTLRASGTEIPREDFIAGHPQAQSVFSKTVSEIGKEALEKAKKAVAPEVKPSLVSRALTEAKDAPTKVQEAFTTRYIRINELEKEILKSSGSKEKPSLIREFENYSSDKASAAAKVNQFRDDVISDIDKAGLREEFKQFLFMERNRTRLNAGIKTGDWTPEMVDSGIAELKKQIGDDKFSDLQRASKRFQEYADDTLRTLESSGVISKEGIKAIRDRNDFYAPFKVLKYMEKEGVMEGAGKSVNMSRQDVIKAMVGISTDEIRVADLVDEMAKKIYQARLVASKNRIMQEFSKLADVDGSPIKRISSASKKSTPDKGMELVHYMENGKVNILEVPKEVANAIKGLNQNELGVITKGMKQAMIPARAGITTLNVGFQAANFLIDMGRLATVSKFRIKNPVDAGKFVYDYASSLVKSLGGNFDDVIQSITRGKIKTKGAEYSEAELEGIFSGTVYNSYLKEFGKQTGPVSSKVHKSLDIFDKIGNTIEETSKLAGYKRGLRDFKEGKITRRDLLYEIRNYAGSPDFSRGGTITPEANILFMFFNARIQGIASDVRRLSGYSDGGKEAAKAWTSLAALVGTPVTLNAIRNNTQYKEDLEKLTDWERANNIVIFKDSFIKDDNGEYVLDSEGKPIRDAWKIPVRDTLGAVKNLTETVIDSAYNKDEKLRNKLIDFAQKTIEGFSPINIQGETVQERGQSIVSSTNPLIKAFYEATSGVDPYRHRKIEPEYLGGEAVSDLPPELRKKDSTPSWAVRLGELTGTSPLIVEKIANDFGAGVFTQFKGTDSRGNALSRRFIRSVYYKENEEFVKELQGMKEADAVEGIAEYSKAKVIYESVRDLGEDERKKILKELKDNGELTEGVAKKIAKIRDQNKFGYSKEDSLLRDLGVDNGDRARAIYKKAKDMDPEKRKEYLQSLKEKKILTENVARQISILRNKQP